MKSVTNTLKSFADLVFLSPVLESEITKAENKLSLTFAPEYREYLSMFGVAAANRHELTGIVNSERLNVVSVTIREWGLNPQVPRSMYVVENVAIDGIIIWQDASGKVFQSPPNSAPKVISASLAEYLTA